MKESFKKEFIRSAKQAPRIYFAPVIGALRAIRAEFSRAHLEENDQPSQAFQADEKKGK